MGKRLPWGFESPFRHWYGMTDDKVNHPRHYTSHPSGVECIQITEHFNFNVGNAIKYLWRCGLKNDEIEDLEKARWYIEREIAKRASERRAGEKALAELVPCLQCSYCFSGFPNICRSKTTPQKRAEWAKMLIPCWKCKEEATRFQHCTRCGRCRGCHSEAGHELSSYPPLPE